MFPGGKTLQMTVMATYEFIKANLRHNVPEVYYCINNITETNHP